MSKRVFICHSSENKDFAERVRLRLEAFGHKCWVAHRDVPPGIPYSKAIMQGLDETIVLVVLASNAINSSGDVLREINAAVKRKIRIITLRIDDVQLVDELDYYLSPVQWIDSRGERFSTGLIELLDAVAGVIGSAQDNEEVASAAELTRPPVPVIKLRPRWERIFAVVAFLGALEALLLWPRHAPDDNASVPKQPSSEAGILGSPDQPGGKSATQGSLPGRLTKTEATGHQHKVVNRTYTAQWFQIGLPSDWTTVQPKKSDPGMTEFTNHKDASIVVGIGEPQDSDPITTPMEEEKRFRESSTHYMLSGSSIKRTTYAGAPSAVWEFELRKRSSINSEWGGWQHRKIYYLQNSHIIYVISECAKETWPDMKDTLGSMAESIRVFPS